MNQTIYLQYGEGEDENIIVGNKQGILSLIAACEKTLTSTNEYHTDSLGELADGVKKVTNDYFKKQNKQTLLTKVVNYMMPVIFVYLIISLVVGIITTVKYIFT